MKLTSKLEAEILKTYYTYWDAYLKGDMETFAGFLDDNISVFGTAVSEVFTNKKDAVRFYKATTDQMTGKAQFRNRKIRLQPLNDTVLTNEQSDLYILIDEKWTFYGHARISGLFRQTKSGWKLVHQHGSFPDSRTREGEQIASEKIKEENLQLREAVKRRTVELESKNRELEIETALEKVRTVAMGMRKPDDMLEVCQVISQQSESLGIKEIRNVQTAIIYEDKGTYLNYEYYAKHDKLLVTEVDYKNHELQSLFANRMLQGAEELFAEALTGKEVSDWYEYQQTTNQFADSYLENAQSLNYYFYSLGPVALGMSTYVPLSDEEISLFKRFRNVFDLAYRRFLDIQKAEAQAREAQIELALERVRAGAMAMRQSDELSSLIFVLYQELTKLDARLDRCFLMIVNQENKGITWWMAGQEGLLAENGFFVQMNEHPSHLMYLDYCKQRKKKWTYLFKGKEKRDWDRFGFSKTELTKLPEPVKAFMAAAKQVHLSGSSDQFGSLVTGSFEPLPEEQQDIISRFTIAFNQAYIRFLDLQKAEAQAREAQIEAALERVRSRSMGMQISEELKEVIKLVYLQLLQLKINLDHAGFVVDYKPKGDWNFWIADEQDIPSKITHPYFESVWASQFNEAKEKGADFFVTTLNFEEKNKFYQELLSYIPGLPEASKDFYLSCPGLAATTVLFNNVCLYIENFSGIPYSDEDNTTLMRFGKVFEQTYTRFLDLQKAEAQAIEAQIEAALERIRSRALAMHKSSEVGDVSDLLFSELEKMDISPTGFSIMVFDREQDKYELWRAKEVAHQGVYETFSIMEMYDKLDQYIPGFTEELESKWNSGAPYFIAELSGKKRISFLEANREMGNYSKEQFENVLRIYPDPVFWQLIFFKHGWLGLIHNEQLPADDLLVIRRFADVFEFAHTRFLDLQKAEAQARESQIEAALERVRSRTMAMQKSDELAETSAVLFQQLILLGIEPNRLYITIIKDDQANAEFWITDEDGSKVSSAFETNLNNNPVFKKMLEGWKGKKNSLTMDMKGKELQEYFKYLSSLHVPFKGGLEQTRRIQYIGYFNKGFIGMASPVVQPEETIQLLARFAAVFNLTFTRFNDLKIAEAHAIQAEEDLVKLQTEKQRAEEALAELQVTQKQLIQSEKMASLGELTAGIAHEIQNPLNFVNNFSEVSSELLDEMSTELDRGDTEEAKAIATDVKLNLEKILHHGKRADAIVKGMLQHSRSSSGVKEPTDINVLADEYLRLAYHGLRAKDKSFNATIKTDFDESIGKIDIVPQDIGRVILNLITNAFYAVDEKRKMRTPEGFKILQGFESYEPTVSVATRRTNSTLELLVIDNGNGIPQKALDKIFQPFFTTKPTGQGTGLGLSLSYDITKAHGGELTVETEVGKGSKFIVRIPV